MSVGAKNPFIFTYFFRALFRKIQNCKKYDKFEEYVMRNLVVKHKFSLIKIEPYIFTRYSLLISKIGFKTFVVIMLSYTLKTGFIDTFMFQPNMITMKI